VGFIAELEEGGEPGDVVGGVDKRERVGQFERLDELEKCVTEFEDVYLENDCRFGCESNSTRSPVIDPRSR
jgi:hypothetical protein